MRAPRGVFVFLVVFLLLGCGAGTSPPRSAGQAPKTVLIGDVPHLRQKPGFGGEACAAMFLAKLGKNVGQDDVYDASGLDPLLGRGCGPQELAAALGRLGFSACEPWRPVPAAGEVEAQFRALCADLEAGVPSIVALDGEHDPSTPTCFWLVLGFDERNGEVVYHDPFVRGGAYQRTSLGDFLRRWPLPRGAGRAVARIPLRPVSVSDARKPAGLREAAYAQRVIELREGDAKVGYTIVLERPFVVIGDEPPEMVQRRAEGTVRWAVERLKRDFFQEDPKEVLDIWLFKDDGSYRTHAAEFFGTRPSSPFGYFLESRHALVMNIGTGGGTLVHEIVHPFMAANFPRCPSWFNEGMASLFEHCGDRDGHIAGYTNWRLPGLQNAIREDNLRSFESLCGTSTEDFYDVHAGIKYAQARYLCYYLQEKGLLVRYYKEFSASVNEDPTGYKTLQSVLGAEDMGAFQKRWEAWVLTLRPS